MPCATFQTGITASDSTCTSIFVAYHRLFSSTEMHTYPALVVVYIYCPLYNIPHYIRDK